MNLAVIVIALTPVVVAAGVGVLLYHVLKPLAK